MPSACAVVLLSAALACDQAPPDESTESVPPIAPSLPQWVAVDTLPLLAADAAARWRLSPLRHVPEYFQLVAWKDSVTLWGLAGCNPVEVRTDTPSFQSWDVEACGGIAPAPDGQRLAWSDGKGGLWVADRRGAVPHLVLAAGTPSPVGEGDPTGLILWSPNGTRILSSWAVEWNSHYAILSSAGGDPSPLDARLEGYYLVGAWGWLDDDALLFSAHAVQDQQGRSEYSESGGPRKDLAVAELSRAGLERVTSVADGTFLEPLGRWGTRVLVGERERSATLYQRYWAYDPSDWSRDPVGLPAGTGVQVFDTTRVLILDRSAAEGPVRVRVFLWTGEGTAEPLFEIQEGAIAWSGDGRRIAFSTSVDEPVAGQPGSFRARYYAYVLEPR